MPKRTSSRKLDTIQNALRVVQESTNEPRHPTTKKPTKSLISQVMAEMGRRGGKIGGKRRLETMTGQQRKEIASAAAKARWAKRAPAPKRKP